MQILHLAPHVVFHSLCGPIVIWKSTSRPKAAHITLIRMRVSSMIRLLCIVIALMTESVLRLILNWVHPEHILMNVWVFVPRCVNSIKVTFNLIARPW